MKILGFYFGVRPGVDAHVTELLRKVRSRSWIIRNLKRSGLPPADLLKCYFSLIRPVLDYCCQVYHPMLNGLQTEKLEKLQRDIYKTIFSFDKSYRQILEDESLETLQERRQKLCDQFTVKMSESPRFGEKWFPTKTFVHPDLRRERIYVERYARTERLRTSPLYTMRRRMNEIGPVVYVK